METLTITCPEVLLGHTETPEPEEKLLLPDVLLERIPPVDKSDRLPSLLALDLATQTGYAGIDTLGGFYSGSLNFAEPLRPKDRKRPAILAEARSILEVLIDETRPDRIVYEAPFMRGPGSRLLWGLTATVECLAAERAISVAQLEVKKVRKRILGNGAATKQDVQNYLRRNGLPFGDADEADAIVLLLAS